MSFFDYFRALQPQKTAKVAKERLQIIVAHERRLRNSKSPDYLPLLQRELLEVVRKYVAIEDEQIKIHIEKEGDYEILELNITLPDVESRQIGDAE
jgi:cell division topological specificity factor